MLVQIQYRTAALATIAVSLHRILTQLAHLEAGLAWKGILRARYRKGLAATELLEPNVVDEFRITLCPVSHVFMKGRRVRLDIIISNFPRLAAI